MGIAQSELTEKQWQQQVVSLARQTGWRLYHTLRSKGSQPGYPDLTAVRERVVFLELKREGGKVTEKQIEWLAALASADAEVYVARPADLDALALIFASRDRSAGEELAHATRVEIGLEEAPPQPGQVSLFGEEAAAA